MRKVCLCVIAIALTTTLISQNNTRARAILLQSAQQLNNAKALTYVADYYFKSFDSYDTLTFRNVTSTLSSTYADTILGFYAKVQEDSVVERMYDGSAFYLVDFTHKSILRDNPVVSGKNFTKNNIRREVIPSFLYQKTPYSFYLDSTNRLSLEDSSGDTYNILVDFPKSEEITELKVHVYINKRTLLPTGYLSQAEFENIQHEFKKLVLKQMKILKKPPLFQLPNRASGYNITDFKSPNVNYDLLPVGASLPAFNARDINGEIVTSEQLRGKLVLLSFWYTACPPCIREFATLDSINEEFGNKGLLIAGMNSYDTSEERIETVKTFANKFKLRYPLYISSKTIDQQFSIKIYPSVYLIDHGKILYRHYGFSEENNIALKKAIEGVLGK